MQDQLSRTPYAGIRRSLKELRANYLHWLNEGEYETARGYDEAISALERVLGELPEDDLMARILELAESMMGER